MLLPLVLVRLLSQDEIGLYKLFFLYTLIVPELLLSGGVTSGVGGWSGCKRARSLFGAGAIALISAASIATVLLLSIDLGISELFQGSEALTWLFALAVFPLVLNAFLEEVWVASHSVWSYAVFSAALESSRLLFMLAAGYWLQSVDGVVVAYLVATGLKTVLAFLYLLSQRAFSWNVSYSDFREVLMYAVPITLSGLVLLVGERADLFFLSQNLTAREFALYSMGCLMLPPLFIFEHSLTRVALPKIARALKQGALNEAREEYRRRIAELFLILFPAAVFLAIFAEPLVRVLYTDQYVESAPVLAMFALTYILLAFPYDLIPRAINIGRWIFLVCSLGALISVVLTAVLGLSFGMLGALAAVLLSKAAVRVIGLRKSAQIFGAPLRDCLPLDAMLRTAGWTALPACAVLLSRPLFESSVVWFLVTAPIGGLSVVALGLAVKPLRNLFPQDPHATLMIVQHLATGGLEKMVFRTARALQANHDVRPAVAAYDMSQANGSDLLVDEIAEAGIPTLQYSKKRGFSLGAVLAIHRFAITHRVSLLHTHDLGGLIYGTAVKLLLPWKVKLVHTQHSFVHLQNNPRYWWYEYLFTSFVDKLVVVSPSVGAVYQELGVRSQRIEEVPNGVSFRSLSTSPSRESEKERLSALYGIAGNPEKNWLVYVARVHPGKGHHEALKLWKHLPASVRAESRLFFVGPWREKSYRSELEEVWLRLPMSERVHFVGGSDQPEAWYTAADLCFSCSEYEGHPLVPVEAIGEGAPFLASDIPGHSFIGEFGFLYPAGSPREGAAAVVKLLERKSQDPQGFQELIERSRHRIRARYSEESSVKKYSQIYETCLEPNSISSVMPGFVKPQILRRGV